MLTQQEIEGVGFTYWRSSELSPTNTRAGRDDYLAVGIRNKDRKNEYQRVLLLSYDGNGYLTITDYWNDPLRYREFYVFQLQISTVEELENAIEKSKFEVEEIDLEELTTDYA